MGAEHLLAGVSQNVAQGATGVEEHRDLLVEVADVNVAHILLVVEVTQLDFLEQAFTCLLDEVVGFDLGNLHDGLAGGLGFFLLGLVIDLLLDVVHVP